MSSLSAAAFSAASAIAVFSAAAFVSSLSATTFSAASAIAVFSAAAFVSSLSAAAFSAASAIAVFSAAALTRAFSASIFASATFLAADSSTLGTTGVITAFGVGGITTLGAVITAALGAATVFTTAAGVVTFFTSFTSEPVVATRTAERAMADPNPAALSLIPFLVN